MLKRVYFLTQMRLSIRFCHNYHDKVYNIALENVVYDTFN